MGKIQKLFMIMAGLLTTLSTQAQMEVANTMNDVGEIPIQYALSPSGATTYQIPVDIYPDQEQFQPNLFFSYNSQQGESAVGYGWNIGGLSAITHVAGSIYYDGSTSPLSLTGDKLMLDGVRLIKTGTDTWQTEQGFVCVQKQADGILKVRYPNGNTATFETLPNAPFSYVITGCRNMKGRTIKYVYSQAGNLPYIEKVMYGENDGVYNDSILFSYRQLEGGITRYADGKPIQYSRLLNSVESYHRGKLWRRYLLTYEKEEVNQLVRLDCETENRTLNPLQFEYGSKKSIENYVTSQVHMQHYFPNRMEGTEESKGYKSLVLSRGRFSNNYRSDGLVSYPQLSTYKVVKTSTGGNAQYDSFYDENQTLLVYKELSGNIVTPVFFTAGKGFQQMIPADIEGKGEDVLVKVNYYLDDQGMPMFPKLTVEKLIVSIHGSPVDPNSCVQYTHKSNTYVKDGSLLSPRQREFLLGDFNGDGKTELLAISSCRNHVDRDSKITSNALLIDLKNRTTLFDGDCFDYAFFQEDPFNPTPDKLIAMDYNGDGKTDVCLINRTGTSVYEFTGDGFKLLAYISLKNGGINSSEFNHEDCELLVADMNGDGNMDLILSPRYSRLGEEYKHLGDGICCNACKDEENLSDITTSGYKIYVDPSTGNRCVIDPNATQTVVTYDKGKKWQFLLSTGNSEYSNSNPGFTTYYSELFHGFHETVGQNFMLVDINNDGLPDLLRNVKGTVDLYLNVDGKLSDTPQQRTTISLSNLRAQFASANVAQPYFWAGGLICVDDCYIRIYDYSRKENKERMLHSVTNSHGLKNNHSYEDIMSTTSANYESGNGQFGLKYLSFPYVVMSPHCYVNVCSKKMDGTDILSWDSYKYKNAVFHRSGLGFCGFQQIETTDVINSRQTISTLDPVLRGSEVKLETPTDTITREYVKDVDANRLTLIKLQKEVVRNALNKTETTTECQYNAYGQPIYMAVSKGAFNKEITSNEYLNINDETQYLLGLSLLSVVEKMRSDSVITQSDVIEYDANYLPSRKISSINGREVLEEHFVYDSYLRPVVHEQRSFESTDWLVTTYAYDNQGRISRQTDGMGLSLSYAYDAATGLLSATSDHKGRMTWNEYDEWGAPLAVHYPDGRVKRVTAAWCDVTEPGLYVITTTETGKPTVKTYFDRLNREVRNVQIRFDGKAMKTDTKYNANTGLRERVSQPTTDEQPSLWNRYVYDKFGRCTSVHHASGKIDSHVYGVLVDTITENGIRRIREYDEAGLLVQTTDPAGCIQYYYRPDGSPLVIVAPGEVQTRFYYDDYNRRVAIKDPSAGIRRTVYDKAGNICEETDADGREIIREYDRYGRVTKQVTSDLATVYIYDDTEDLLLSAVSDNGSALYNTYDECGRLKTQREEAPDGKWLQKTYGYTFDGLLESITYISQNGTLATELLSYRNGFLTEVHLADGTQVYRHDEENSLGQLTQLTAGGMQRNYEFNEWGLPVRRSISRTDHTVMFDYSYHFNAVNGNLLNRTDEIRNLSEGFGYDELNRLCSYGDNTVIYDNYGNIRSKGDAGQLAYTNPNRPYGVTGLTPVEDNLVKSGLDITYIAGDRPSVITQDRKRAVLAYNASHDRIRMQFSVNDLTQLTRYYLGGSYELEIDSTGIEERLYLGGSYYDAPAVLVKQNGGLSVYYIHRDYLGSILQIADTQGNVVEENSFDAWGCRRNLLTHEAYVNESAPGLMLGRGFTGHEHLPMFGLINMNARLYDPVLGRFLSPDPYVQMLDNTQAFNRYSYCMNSPLCYVDENGEFFLSILVGTAIGAVVSAISYSVATIAAGQPWDSGGFWKSVGVGAVGGAIGGACGYIGSTWLGDIGNTFGYNMVSNVANLTATNAIFGYDTGWSDVLSTVAGAAIGSALPAFNGVDGGKFANGVSEIGYNTMRGTVTGLASGVVNAAIQKEPDRIWQGIVGGAISGASRSVAMNVIFGAPYKVDKSYGTEGLYRGGGISDLLDMGLGLTIGRNMYVRSDIDDIMQRGTRYHENKHLQQQNESGWARFYGEIIFEYLKYGYDKSPLEIDAKKYENDMNRKR